MRHVMIDVETLGTDPDAVVMSLGAVRFDLGLEGIDDDHFHHYLDIDPQLVDGRTVNGPTVRWWMTQSEQARKQFSFKGLSPALVLDAFDQYFAGTEYIWSHGSNFDTVILDNLYQGYGRKPPWKFQNVRDTRTLFGLIEDENALYDIKGALKPDGVVAHHALMDAYNQAQAVRLALLYLSDHDEFV